MGYELAGFPLRVPSATKKRPNRRVRRCFGIILRLGLILTASFVFLAPAQAQTATADQPQPIRFAVAHDHKFSWCYGYLYIDADTISYEVDHPSQYKKHEFKIKRSELQTFGRWRVLGQSLDTLELKFGKSTYHLWWLQDENEVHTGPERRTEPLVPAAPDVIIAAIKDPASASAGPQQNAAPASPPAAPPAQAMAQSPAYPQSTTSSNAASAAGGHIGIAIKGLTTSQKKSLGTNGALVMHLEPEGPAAQAGVRVNDVITAVNGRPVSGPTDVTAAVTQLNPGSAAQLQVLRTGQPLSIKVFVALGPNTMAQSAPSSLPGTTASADSFGSTQSSAVQNASGFGSALAGATASQSSAPPDTPPPPRRLSGVYAGMHFGYGPGASAVGEIRMFVFYPDGTGMYLPEAGLDGYDLAREIRAGLDPLQYGTYQYHNNHVDFRSRDGTANGFDIDPNGDVPSLNTYVRMCHCNGVRLSGTYYWGSRNLAITFLSDGRFVDRGAMYEAFQYNNYQNPRIVAPGAGTYSVVDYTIHLDYADGRHLRRSFVLSTPSQTPDGVWIAGARFSLVSR
jgi:hypothetical protein